MKHQSIIDFTTRNWSDLDFETHYIEIDVVYPECCVPQLIFCFEGFHNFSKSILREESEVKRIVWRRASL